MAWRTNIRRIPRLLPDRLVNNPNITVRRNLERDYSIIITGVNDEEIRTHDIAVQTESKSPLGSLVKSLCSPLALLNLQQTPKSSRTISPGEVYFSNNSPLSSTSAKVRSWDRAVGSELISSRRKVIPPSNEKFNEEEEEEKRSLRELSKPTKSCCSPISIPKVLISSLEGSPLMRKKEKSLEFDPEILLLGGTAGTKYPVLGHGGFGTVILAKCKGKELAVKVVSSRAKESLKKEKLAVGLSHTSVIKIIGVIDKENAPYGLVLMEPFSSLTLHRLVERVGLVRSHRLRYLIDVCEGLKYIHSLGIIHLDLKPLNILVDPQIVRAKICDFGTSLITGTMVRQLPQMTVAYAAPELLKFREASTKCDIYSFGVTMWQALTETIPYKGYDKQTVLYKVVQSKERPVNLVWEKGYSDLYVSCWDDDPHKRPKASQIAAELQLLHVQFAN